MTDDKTTPRLTDQQRDIYDGHYIAEARLELETYPLDFLDVRLRSSWCMLPSAPAILDVGCGSGNLLLRQRPSVSLRYVGVDISHVGLVKASEAVIHTYPSCGFVQSLADDLPFNDSSFDGVFAIGIIEHLPDPERFVSECARECKARWGDCALHSQSGQSLHRRWIFSSLLSQGLQTPQ